MNIQIAEEIKELLYDNGSVVIPGLGTFTGSYKSASIDNIQGSLSPPALEIEFNSDNIINDGVLVDFLQKKYNIASYEAQKVIDTFREDALQTFKRHEILLISDVGRLYRDYTDKVRFLPEKTNFNTDSFGLPAVQFYPVSRSRPEPVVEPTPPPVMAEPVIPQEPQPVPPPKEMPAVTIAATNSFPESVDNISTPLIPEKAFDLGIPFEFRKFAPGLAVALVIVLGYSIYLFSSKNPRSPLAKPKVNEKPESSNGVVNTLPKESAKTITPPPQPVPAPPPVNQNKSPKDIASEKYGEVAPDKANTEGSIVPSTKPQNKAVIIVGGFVNKNNIRRLKTWISNNGYTVYEKKSGGLTVIGAEVNYANQKDLNKILKRFRTRFGDEVEIIRK